MDQPLLSTKLRIPNQPGVLLRRQAQIDRLEEAGPRSRMILVAAPAGYGKTCLVSDWARRSEHAFGWYTLDEGEDTPDRFLRYLLAAWGRVRPGILDAPVGLLLGSMQPDRQAALAALINEASQLSEHHFIVLDDYQLATDPAIHKSIEYLLDHLPPQLHFVIVTRTQPPLPLARLRGRGQLLELGARELSLDTDEANRFLQEKMGLELPPSVLQDWQSSLEGWVGGLQLAALGYRGGGTELSGRQRHLADFLADEVLARQPASVRDFLLTTSVLDRLTGSLCDALTGNANGRATLERLEQNNLFLVGLDDDRQWYRYHGLFQQFLQNRLRQQSPGRGPELHSRAARWYRDHEMSEQATRHAIEGGDADLLTEIGDGYFIILLNRGELARVRQLLDSIPADWFDEHPMLSLARAAYHALSGEFETSQHMLARIADVTEGVETAEAERVRSRLIAFRCTTACMQNDLEAAETFGNLADQELDQDDLFFRELINLSMGDTYRQNGQWEQAKDHYQRALEASASPSMRFNSVHAHGALADLSLRRGHLRKAYESWQRALAVSQEAPSWGAIPLPVLGWVHIRMAEILYEWNRLDEAGRRAEEGMTRAELGEDVRSLIAGCAIRARLARAEGDLDRAWEHLQEARPHFDRSQFPEWRAAIRRLELVLLLAMGRKREALEDANRILEVAALEEPGNPDPLEITACRVLIDLGTADDLIRARRVLQKLAEAARRAGRGRVHLETLALLALAAWKTGQDGEALAHVEQALLEAEPEGYLRLFLDLGRPFARLLQEADSRHALARYGANLLSCFDREAALGRQVGANGGLIDPLTERENEVLRLLAAGLTNREIGDQLFIAAGTVKKHTAHIYSKLNVSSRTEAAAVARDIGLLD
jgi:LuxR family maltose regulon positive regulatory protein